MLEKDNFEEVQIIRKNITRVLTSSDEHYETSITNQESTQSLNQSNLRKSHEQIDSENNGHVSYQEYKAAGEYWNKYPKTDYTYSYLSPHRREVLPGAVAMPNMSRQSLLDARREKGIMSSYEFFDHNTELQKTSRFDNERRREASSLSYRREIPSGAVMMSNVSRESLDARRDKFNSSTFEFLDHSMEVQKNLRVDSERRSETVSFTSSLWLKFFSIMEFLFGENTSIQSKHACFENTEAYSWTHSSLWARFTNFQQVYHLVSSVLFIDTLILKSNYKSLAKKWFLMFLILLVPLLLFTGAKSAVDEKNMGMITRVPFLVSVLLVTPMSLISTAVGQFAVMNSLKSYMTPLFSLQPLNVHQNLNMSKLPHTIVGDQYNSIFSRIDDYVQNLLKTKLANERELLLKRELNMFSKVRRMVNAVNNVDNKPMDAQIKKIAQLASEIDSNDIQKIKNIDQLPWHMVNEEEFSSFFKSTSIGKDVFEKLTQRQQILNALENDLSTLKQELNSNIVERDDNLMDSINANYRLLAKQIQDLNEIFLDKSDKIIGEIDFKIAAVDERSHITLEKYTKCLLYYLFEDSKNNDNMKHECKFFEAFISKESLREYISIRNHLDQKIELKFEKFGASLVQDVLNKINSDVLKTATDINSRETSSITKTEIRNILIDLLATYDADKTGKADYALESSGGQVISTRCTESYDNRPAQLSIFGLSIFKSTNTPRTAISPSIHPGECWAFKGFPGFLVIKLNAQIFVTGYSIEHIPKNLTPYGKIDSAPKKFSVWGLNAENDMNPNYFGEHEYLDNGSSLQYFQVENIVEKSFDIIELRIESNHGNSLYTCLYRFRVHGTPNI